ncbi:cytochrome C biogenesis protein [Paenibacillus sp. MY03]|uniref:Cytochrome C biogenesis protein CcdA n=1 Tax=Paenibacillus agaridevorans TaxID=171404 RepID=A0A2R5F213_9BACL|nr:MULTISPECIES: cytochrome c biogenesis protein CcdA [Paenibacillus]OUS77481.1 cytochrome C biogenesis protein [Paenibacillus sp. MY03]GBG12149.1 cytochrome C biogenesis protein CcdA [Paenibacillus agaridevorans]
MSDMNLWIALGAGFASFISPCCLPLYPSYLSYITGISVSELKDADKTKGKRLLMMSHTLFFVLGFSTVYYTLGYGTNVFSEFFSEYNALIRQLSAILIILMGLFLMGIFKPGLLMKERRMNLVPKRAGYLSSFVFGIGFSAGWTPCTGPVLTAILGLAASEPGTWFGLTTAYSLGFAIPFFVLAFFLGTARWILKYSAKVMKIGGGVMILMGILLFTDQMTQITIWLNMITPEWLKF